MARLTYTEDRETFEREMFRAPFMARMLEMAGRYARSPRGHLSGADKEAVFKGALDAFWAFRDDIRETKDILRLWEKALRTAAAARPRWLVWSQVDLCHIWIAPAQLGRS